MQQNASFGLPCFFNNGWQAPFSLRLVQETTRFAEFGPLSGSTFSARLHLRAGDRQLPAAPDRRRRRPQVPAPRPDERAAGPARPRLLLERREPRLLLLRRQHGDARATPTSGFSGNQGFFANAELRLPLIHLAATPIGIIGPLRGTVYFGIAGASFKGQEYKFSTKEPGYSYVRRPHLRRAGHRLSAAGRPRLLGLRAPAVLPRLPAALRLDEVHGLRHDQQGLGLQLLDRVRLLVLGGRCAAPPDPPSLRRSESGSLRARCLSARCIAPPRPPARRPSESGSAPRSWPGRPAAPRPPAPPCAAPE